MQPAALPVQASAPAAPAVQSSELQRHSQLRRLFTTFGYLAAKQEVTAVLGLAYWAVATHLFSARDVGLAAAASSTALFLAAIGALGFRSSCWPSSNRYRPRPAASRSAPGCTSRA